MKIVALVAGLLTGGYYIDSQYYHGRYFREAGMFAQHVITSFR